MENSPKEKIPYSRGYDRESLLFEMEKLRNKFIATKDASDRDKLAEEFRSLSAQEISQAITYEDFLNAHFHSLHPEDRKFTYRKMIELVPNKESAEGLYYNALDSELRELALNKLNDFK